MGIGRRGSVLVHVLMTGVVVSIIAAGLMRMAMLRYSASARATSGASARRNADAGLNRVLTYWNSVNIVCSDNVPGYNCSPASVAVPGTCNCTCTPAVSGQAVITVSGGGPPPCAISITAAP